MLKLKEPSADVGVEIVHTVVVDGKLSDVIPRADVVIELPTHAGTASARNAALVQMDYERRTWVYPLDGDDVVDLVGWNKLLDDGVLNDEIGWIGTNRLTVDGARRTAWVEQRREYEKHEFAETWTRPCPIHPNSILARLELLTSLGGWPSLLGNEDLGYLLFLSSAANGVAVPHVVTRYRVWEKQTSTEGWFSEHVEDRIAFLTRAVNCRRQQDGVPTIDVPNRLPGATNLH